MIVLMRKPNRSHIEELQRPLKETRMPRSKSILSLAAIFAATAASGTAIAGALPTAGHSLPWCSIPKPDRIAAELAATHSSAPLYQFSLIHVRAIPRNTTCKRTKT
jgi:hypothetical protein